MCHRNVIYSFLIVIIRTFCILRSVWNVPVNLMFWTRQSQNPSVEICFHPFQSYLFIYLFICGDSPASTAIQMINYYIEITEFFFLGTFWYHLIHFLFNYNWIASWHLSFNVLRKNHITAASNLLFIREEIVQNLWPHMKLDKTVQFFLFSFLIIFIIVTLYII